VRRFSLLAIAPLAAAACQPAATGLTDALKEQIAAEVNAAATDWWNAWSDVDYDRGMTFFEDAPEAAWTWDKGTLFTVAGMNAEWQGTWCAECAHQQIDFTDSRTIVLAPDIAYTIRQYDAVVTDTTGNDLPMTKGVETIVWVKRDGQWKVMLGHESTLEDSWQVRLTLEQQLAKEQK